MKRYEIYKLKTSFNHKDKIIKHIIVMSNSKCTNLKHIEVLGYDFPNRLIYKELFFIDKNSIDTFVCNCDEETKNKCNDISVNCLKDI